MSNCLIELHFLPSIEYFCSLLPFDKVILEKNENFGKQSYRNRCYVRTAQGIDRVTIPTTAKGGKVLITDVQVDYSKRWQNNFWRRMESAYAKAPFYEHYAEDLKKEIFADHKFLYDLNRQLLSMCLQWLKWSKPLSESVTYMKNLPPETYDLRSQISPKTDFMDRNFYRPQPYQQVFGSNFAPNLSVIDLVFCEGPNSANLVKASAQKLNK